MKRMILLLVMALIARFSIAQTQEGIIEYAKTRQPAVILEVPYAPNVVEGALKDYFGRQGTKAGNSRGLTLYKNARAGKAGSPVLDLYFKIDRKSRKEKDAAVIYLTAAPPGENIATRNPDDRYGIEKARPFLENIMPVLEAHSLELQITDQENEVKKAEKKYKSSISEGEDLVKRKKSIEEKIVANAREQEEQKSSLEKQKNILEVLNKKKNR